MQNYNRIYQYIEEYQRLVYDYYSKHGIAFLVTYYNINKDDTVWDTTDLMGGYYEKVGELTGVKFNKYLLLPVYFSEEVSTAFDGQDIGLNKENTFSITIPSSYGLTPYSGDMIKISQDYMRPTNNVYPMFQVTGIEVSANTDRRYWKLRVETDQSLTQTQVDLQVQNTYVFFDYDKKIHSLSNSESMTRMMIKSELIKDQLKNLWDSNSGYYFI